MSALQFLISSIGATVVISLTSLLWPKFTTKPSPPVLTQVRKVVEQTPLGRQAADVLGVSDSQETAPVNVKEWAVAQGNAIVSNIEDSASRAVVSSVVRQMVGQIDKLPNDQKLQLQQILCSTQSATKQ